MNDIIIGHCQDDAKCKDTYIRSRENNLNLCSSGTVDSFRIPPGEELVSKANVKPTDTSTRQFSAPLRLE